MNVVSLQDSFLGGMKRDVPRNHLPQDACWNLVDVIPELDAPATKRGGWSYASADISATTATASYVVAGAFPRFVAGAKNCCFDEDGRLHTIAANGTVTAVGLSNASTPIAPLVVHREHLIITRGDGTTAPGSYDGTTLGALGGSPPTGKYAAVYKDFALLANTLAEPQRIYFSTAGDPEQWNTSVSWIDASYPLTGIAALRNAILCFSLERLERIRGSIPPPGSDMTMDVLWEPGTLDARSIVFFDDAVVFAATSGIYMTDGASVVDVTERCGFLRYWEDLLSTYATTWTFAAGRHRQWYVISVMDGSTFKDALAIDPIRNIMVRLSNIKTTMFWMTPSQQPDFYWGLRAGPRVVGGESMWNPAAGVKNDADSTAVTMTVEFPFWEVGQSKATARLAYVNYDMRDAASDNPTMALSYVKYPEETSYTAISDYAGSAFVLPETTQRTRTVRKLAFRSEGLALRLVQSNASSATRLWRVELNAHPSDQGRV